MPSFGDGSEGVSIVPTVLAANDALAGASAGEGTSTMLLVATGLAVVGCLSAADVLLLYSAGDTWQAYPL